VTFQFKTSIGTSYLTTSSFSAGCGGVRQARRCIQGLGIGAPVVRRRSRGAVPRDYIRRDPTAFRPCVGQPHRASTLATLLCAGKNVVPGMEPRNIVFVSN